MASPSYRSLKQLERIFLQKSFISLVTQDFGICSQSLLYINYHLLLSEVLSIGVVFVESFSLSWIFVSFNLIGDRIILYRPHVFLLSSCLWFRCIVFSYNLICILNYHNYLLIHLLTYFSTLNFLPVRINVY